MIPAMKRVVAEFAHAPDWRVVRPPLTTMDDAAVSTLATHCAPSVRHAGLSTPLIRRRGM
jgi:hypothetical protein